MSRIMTLGTSSVPYATLPGPEAESKTERDIHEFMQLPTGWHYGDGGPIGEGTSAMALELNRHAIRQNLTVTEAFPGINGEVMVSVYFRGHTLDFTIFAYGLINFRHEISNEEVEAADHLTLEGAKEKLTTFGFSTWNLSDSSTPNTSVGKPVNSRALRSRQARKTKAYLLLTEDVPWELANQNATT